MKHNIVILIISCILFGCGPKEYVDISDDTRFASILGKQVTSLIMLKVHGVTYGIDGHYEVDFIYLTTPPGIGGNRVKFYDELPKGVTLTIIGVMKSAYSESTGLFYIVKIIDDNKYKDYRILIDVTKELDSLSLGLDTSVFIPK